MSFCCSSVNLKDFNPRTPAKECDPAPFFQATGDYQFQSTHPREGVRLGAKTVTPPAVEISIHAPPRRSATWSWSLLWKIRPYFNPRTPAKECDSWPFRRLTSVTYISIHAPPRRSATQSPRSVKWLVLISIHAPPRRSATLISRKIWIRFRISIHAPPRRSATTASSFSPLTSANFNPRTPAKECDRI